MEGSSTEARPAAVYVGLGMSPKWVGCRNSSMILSTTSSNNCVSSCSVTLQLETSVERAMIEP